MMLYFPLSFRTRHIRLLVLHPGDSNDRVECGLVHHDLNVPQRVRFEALSYTWGDPKDSASISLKGCEFVITKSLEGALRSLRPKPVRGDVESAKPRYLWVDAICINQQDLSERNEQVLRMPDIYQSAERTIVWLGEGSAESDKAMDFVNQNEQRAKHEDSDLFQPRHYRDEYLALVGGLLIRPWWQRIWIVQEVAVSNNLIVICGCKTVNWSTLMLFISFVHMYHKPAVAQILRGIDADEVRNTNLGIRLSFNRTQWHENGPQPLFQLIIQFRSWKATLHADKVYGVLGMAAEANHPVLKPDYKKLPQDIFGTVTRFIIEQQQQLGFICIATGSQKLDGLPSWAPDLTVPGVKVVTPLKGYERLMDRYLYSAAKDVPMGVSFSEDSRIMYADGIRADMVERMAPYWDPAQPTFLDFLQKLNESTFVPWAELLQPVAASVQARYGAEFALSVALGKMLTADRTVDFKWNVSRFEPDKSWWSLPIDPPAYYQDATTAEDQWNDDKRTLVEGGLTGRRFMVTKSGYIGLVPESTEVGDVICVLFGCDTPLVLRPVEDHYFLIGECYVYGLMDGELVAALERGLAQKECFELH